MTAIATASRNPVLQGFCKRFLKASSNPFLLLWFDPDLRAENPEGKLPRGRAFYDNGAQLFSRSDWDPVRAEMIVYVKAKRDHNHAHNDVGQLCIDARGQRMIVDPGSPSGYSEDFFDKDLTGELLEQRREPYVETRFKDRRYRVLSLFSLAEGASTSETWRQEHDGWSIGTNAGECHVQVDDRFLSVSDQSILKSLRVRL